MSNSDGALANAYDEISNMADRLNLHRKIVDKANRLLKSIHNRKILKGHSTDAVASACLYIICRQEGTLRPFKEFCAASKFGKKEIGRCFKLILEAMKTSVNDITTSDFIPIFCVVLGLPAIVQRAASDIGCKAAELDIVPERSSVSVAAAAIYMASNASDKKLTKKEISDVTGVTDVTIRQSYELMYPRAAELIPAEFELDIGQLPQS